MGRPYSILAILLVGALAGLALTACSKSESASSDPTITPLASVTATPSPGMSAEAGGMVGFRQFVDQVEQALVRRDADFFTGRALITEVRCTSAVGSGPCAGKPGGTVLRGVVSGVWRSDDIQFVPPETVAQGVVKFAADADPSSFDGFGTGRASVYAVAQHPHQPGTFHAIVTGIPKNQLGEIKRIVQVYSFVFDEGHWRLVGHLDTRQLTREWLTGDCTECYTGWERWPR